MTAIIPWTLACDSVGQEALRVHSLCGSLMVLLEGVRRAGLGKLRYREGPSLLGGGRGAQSQALDSSVSTFCSEGKDTGQKLPFEP